MAVRVPIFLNRPMAVLWFESDELIIGLLTFYITLLSGGGILLFLPVIAFSYYKKVKKKSGRGLLRHIPHMLAFKSFQGFPHSYVTEFME